MLVFGPGQKFSNNVIFAITLVNVIVYTLRQLLESNSSDELNNNLVTSPSSSPLGEQNWCRRFSLSEIRSATGNFNHNSVIGKGGFGKVYKGVIKGSTDTNMTVAIKRANPESQQGANEFWNEVRLLTSFRHCHLVSLIGYCDENSEMILVYPYMARGTLADNLYRRTLSPELSWIERLTICIGAARGLDYLHTGAGFLNGVIHRDVKSSNILLDDEFGVAKISDFGLSKKFVRANGQSYTYVITGVRGTWGYLDPDYLTTRKLSKKSDVYAFGVVLFEVLSGRRALDSTYGHDDIQYSLALWAQRCIRERTLDQLIDPRLAGQISPQCLKDFVEIAGKCLRKKSKRRPTMAEVVVKLVDALKSQNSMGSSSSSDEIHDYVPGVFNLPSSSSGNAAACRCW